MENIPYVISHSHFNFLNIYFFDEIFEQTTEQSMLHSTQVDPQLPFVISTTDLKKYIGICLLTTVVNQIQGVIGLQLLALN